MNESLFCQIFHWFYVAFAEESNKKSVGSLTNILSDANSFSSNGSQFIGMEASDGSVVLQFWHDEN